jgi:myo-inositol catabolism protein IolS
MFPSAFGLGTFQFRNATAGSDALRDAHAVWRAAYEHGVRHIDTAQSYGGGVSEQAVGAVLEGFDDVFVATKIHFKTTVAETVQAIEASRTRLGRDIIDVVYLHWPRRGADLRPVMEGLEKCRASGMIRLVGSSNFSVEEFRVAAEVCRVDAFQIGYSLLWRYPERDVIPWCRDHGIAVVCYSALAQGLLAGRIRDRAQLAPDDPRLKTVYYDAGVFEAVQAAVARMAEAAAAAGASLSRLALAWVLARPGIAATLVGASSPAQVAETLPPGFPRDAAAVDSALARLTAISDEVWPSIPDIGNIFKHYP